MPCECRGDDLDTRLLRAMVIKGILEQITNNTVNLVNADLLAKTRGLRIIESIVPAEGRSVTALCGTCSFEVVHGYCYGAKQRVNGKRETCPDFTWSFMKAFLLMKCKTLLASG